MVLTEYKIHFYSNKETEARVDKLTWVYSWMDSRELGHKEFASSELLCFFLDLRWSVSSEQIRTVSSDQLQWLTNYKSLRHQSCILVDFYLTLNCFLLLLFIFLLLSASSSPLSHPSSIIVYSPISSYFHTVNYMVRGQIISHNAKQTKRPPLGPAGITITARTMDFIVALFGGSAEY